MSLHCYGSSEWGRDWISDDYYDVFLGQIYIDKNEVN